MKLIIFSVLIFFSIVAAAFFTPIGGEIIRAEDSSVTEENKYRLKPVLSLTSAYPTFSASGVYAYDIDTNTPLYQKQPNKKVLPASTTKILTALVSLDYYSLDEVISVNIPEVDGQKMGLFNGEKIKVLDLLYGLLLFSANDAAEQLARSYPGGYENFIAQMNRKAKELGMLDSKFRNPQGYEDEQHVSTAEDMTKVAIYALNNPVFAKIVSTKEYTAYGYESAGKHIMKNLNEMLGEVDGVMGIKTGWTESAKENLVTYVVRDGHRIVTSVLGSDDRFGETKELVDWIYSSYSWLYVPYSFEGAGSGLSYSVSSAM